MECCFIRWRRKDDKPKIAQRGPLPHFKSRVPISLPIRMVLKWLLSSFFLYGTFPSCMCKSCAHICVFVQDAYRTHTLVMGGTSVLVPEHKGRGCGSPCHLWAPNWLGCQLGFPRLVARFAGQRGSPSQRSLLNKKYGFCTFSNIANMNEVEERTFARSCLSQRNY